MNLLSPLVIVVGLQLAGCGQSPERYSPIMTTDPQALASLAGHGVLFGHQSVGMNILGGVNRLAQRAHTEVSIAELTQATPPDRVSGIVHFFAGENGDPERKLRDFKEMVSRYHGSIDTALLKFCYIDFEGNVDPTQLADEYTRALAELKAAYPEVRIVAATAPLTVLQTGPKAWVKALIGRRPAGYTANIKRQKFNTYVRAHFAGNDLFDIARVESASGSGTTYFQADGEQIEAMNPELSSDGGHLTEEAADEAADRLLRVLAGVS